MRVFAIILLTALLTGCVSRYKITLTNSSVITTHSRPRLNENKSAYEFKDMHGRPASVPVFRIREIEPL